MDNDFPHYCGFEISEEYNRALIRTGRTEALEMAKERILILLDMKPETVEAYFATRYDEV